MTTYGFFSPKGGVGTSTTAAMFARHLTGQVLLRDLSQAQDVAPALGLPQPDVDTYVDVSDTMTFVRGLSANTDHEHHIIDLGACRSNEEATRFEGSKLIHNYHIDQYVMVVNNTYLSLYHASRITIPHQVVLILDDTNALREADVATVVNGPIMWVIPQSARIQRAVDAGLLSTRSKHLTDAPQFV